MEDRKKGQDPENKSHSRHGHGEQPRAAEKPLENPQPEAGSMPSQEDSGQEKDGKSTETAQVPMVALSMEEFESLQKELEKASNKSNEYFEGWQRERADFLNYKKRIERDAVVNQQNALATIVKKHLVILDDLERAMKTRPVGGDGAGWADGVELIYRKLVNLLEQEGVRRMEAEKEFFDPTRHEAIIQEESPDHKSGQIIEVVQQGYLLGERVIRPALVRVAK
jgi:molecular chaperone GrpE